jgi:hypothetical protein
MGGFFAQANCMKKALTTIRPALLLTILLMTGCSHSSRDARSTPATQNIKGQYIAGTAQLVDAGNTTPEAALETVFWATANGDYDTVISSYAPQMRKQAEEWEGDKTKFSEHVKSKFAAFKGMQIVARKSVAADKVELRFFCEFQKRPGQIITNRSDQVLLLVKVGGAWRCAEKTAYTTNWDEGSQPEPES